MVSAAALPHSALSAADDHLSAAGRRCSTRAATSPTASTSSCSRTFPRGTSTWCCPARNVRMTMVDQGKILFPDRLRRRRHRLEDHQRSVARRGRRRLRVARVPDAHHRHDRLRLAFVLRLQTHQRKVPAQPHAEPLLPEARRRLGRLAAALRRGRRSRISRSAHGVVPALATGRRTTAG